MSLHRFVMPLALVLVIGVIAAPAASGKALLMPEVGNGVATSEQSGQDARSLPAMDAATAAVPAPTQSAEETGFDWSDAGIGASSVAVVLIAAGGDGLHAAPQRPFATQVRSAGRYELSRGASSYSPARAAELDRNARKSGLLPGLGTPGAV
jgi:hypothetical protein